MTQYLAARLGLLSVPLQVPTPSISEQLRSYAEEREYAIGYYHGKSEKAGRIVIRLIRFQDLNMKAEREDSTLAICRYVKVERVFWCHCLCITPPEIPKPSEISEVFQEVGYFKYL